MPKHATKWLWLVLVLVGPAPLLSSGCVQLLAPQLSGWWRVEVAEYQREVIPPESELYPLLRSWWLGGCAGPDPDTDLGPGFWNLHFESDTSTHIYVELDSELGVQGLSLCDEDDSTCEPIEDSEERH